MVGGLSFHIRRSARRRQLSLTVDRGGELVIHCPEGSTEEDLTRWARPKLLWVHRKLADKSALSSLIREPEFVSGESFYYLGRSYRLKVVDEQDDPLCLDGTRFLLRRDALASGADHFRRWYMAVGKDWLVRRVRRIAHRVGAVPERLEVRDLGFRWGSCTRNRAVMFNWRLLQLPVPLIDYVITHELAHLREPHHGSEFWLLLDRALPGWRTRRDDLSRTGAEIYWCHAAMVK